MSSGLDGLALVSVSAAAGENLYHRSITPLLILGMRIGTVVIDRPIRGQKLGLCVGAFTGACFVIRSCISGRCSARSRGGSVSIFLNQQIVIFKATRKVFRSEAQILQI